MQSPSSGYDSGLRSLNDLVQNRDSGDLTIERIGNVVTLSAYNLKCSESGRGNLIASALPVGWRPSSSVSVIAQGLSSRAQVSYIGNLQAYDWTAGFGMFFTIVYTARGLPSIAPGTAA